MPVALAAIALAAPPPAGAAEADAGELVATERGSEVVFSQPGAPAAELRMVATGPLAIEPELDVVGPGLIRMRLEAPAGTPRVSASFARPGGELFMGFGERSDAVVRSAGTVEHHVTEGPYQDVEEGPIAAFVPPPGYTTRDDATYYPVPWLISTRGYGVLIENDATSRHRLGSQWAAEVDASTLRLLIVAGPRPRDVLRRFTEHTGRQPDVMREALGPWWQPHGELEDAEQIEILREAGALGSVAQTYTHYLPCADQLGRRDAERERVELFRQAGLLTTTYFNPMVCTDHPRFDEAAANGWLTETAAGTPAVYRYTGSEQFFVGQIDFTAPGAIGFFGELAAEARADGHAGWMEDFGEYTPLESRSHDGTTGTAHHNAYVRDYHLGAFEATGREPLLRFARSGWTGSALGSPVVWGGDPTTGWGFDGLESAVKNGLSMGLSGVSRWGSDIGGFFALSEQQTSPELLNRWIEVGFASGVMRTQANGFDLGEQISGRRAQITDPEVLGVWSRYARLRTRMLPEILRAERGYERSGMPVMRQLALVFPTDRAAVEREDEYMFGAKMLVAPVLGPGEDSRELYLPEGRWVDLWRSADASLRKLGRPELLRGGREVTVPAPIDELPLLVRWGTQLELLPRGGPSWAEAVDRGRKRRAILAFGDDELKLEGPRKRRYRVQWATRREPRRVTVGGEPHSFSYRRGVVELTAVAKRAKLRLR